MTTNRCRPRFTSRRRLRNGIPLPTSARDTAVASKDAATGADGTVLVDLPISGSGDFEVKATAQTPESRTVEDSTYVWVWNGAGTWYQSNAQAQIVADKKSYSVGDTAHLLLVTGLAESWAVVTTEGDSVQSRQLIHLTGASAAFDVPITQKAQPNLIVTAVIVHDDQLMTAQKSLKVPLVERTLTITATSNKSQYEPEEAASFDVLAVDSAGKPVETDLSFGVVDEALYSVRPDTTPDIVGSFYPQRYVYLEPQTSFDFFFSGQAGTKSPLLADLANGLYHPRMAQVKPGSDLVVPKVRKAFPDTAYWNPSVRTGADGHARVAFNFPDALTTWRTTIRAMSDDSKAGSVVTRVLVRKNLIVRLASPRFFRQGDETVLRVIAHNYLATAKDVTFAPRCERRGCPQRPDAEDHYSRQRRELRGLAREGARHRQRRSHGQGAHQRRVGCTPDDAAHPPIRRPAEFRRLGRCFSRARDKISGLSLIRPHRIQAPRSLTVTVASSVAGTVFDALDYLTSYPWGCTEQTMSSFLPDLIVAQAIDKLHIKSPIDRKTLNDEVSAGLERLSSYQHDDGGWGWWQDDPSLVFMTAYVVSGLGQAKQAGYTIDDDRLNNARNWLLKTLAAHPDMIPDLRAYTVYALATTGGAPKDVLDKAWIARTNSVTRGLR
jgi:alpha-2-macroglobulin